MTLHWIALIVSLSILGGLFLVIMLELWVILRGKDPVQSIDTNHYRRLR